MSLFNKGEIVVKNRGITTGRARIRGLLLRSVIFAIPLICFQQVAGQYRNPYNGVSHTSQLAKFYDMTRTWNSNLYGAMNRYQETKNRLNQLARSSGGSSRVATAR